MNFSELLKEKRGVSDNIKNLYSLPKKNKAIWLIKLENNELVNSLKEWLSFLPINFIIESNNDEVEEDFNNIKYSNNTEKLKIWFDFIVCDSNVEQLNDYFTKWVTPIINIDSHISSILKEFNPIKNEWNSYLYKESNHFDVFYAIIRYLENYKFPFDNKNLVKNIFEM